LGTLTSRKVDVRKITLIFVVFLGIGGIAEARQSWDAGATAGSFGSTPSQPAPAFGDDWYLNGRYAASIGKYWTDHVKTEIEFATTGEGSRYARLGYANVPGVPPNYPISAQEYYRLQQLSGRVVYQFFENAWAHPYVFGGASLDIERRRARVEEQYFYSGSDPRLPANRILITPAMDVGPDIVLRPAGTVGAGAKVYMTPRTYFNAALITSFAKSSRTLSFVGGFGFDF
jgi:hypothetical protein